MAEPIKTAVYMTDEEQEQYIQHLKYMNVLKELERIDFYHMKGGSVELHKDSYGNLSVVILHIHNVVSRHGK